MQRTVVAFPVVAGLAEDDLRSLPRMFTSRPDEYHASRDQLGVTLERTYLQRSADGTMMVIYIESQGPAREVFERLRQSTHAMDREMIQLLLDHHLIDLNAEPSGVRMPEIAGTWADPSTGGRRRGLAYAMSLHGDAYDSARSFAREALELRQDEMTTSRRGLGETVEVMGVQGWPGGRTLLCTYVESTDPVESERELAASTHPFDVWFKNRLRALVRERPSDLAALLPTIRTLFDSALVASRV